MMRIMRGGHTVTVEVHALADGRHTGYFAVERMNTTVVERIPLRTNSRDEALRLAEGIAQTYGAEMVV